MKRVISGTKSNEVSVDKFDKLKIYAINRGGHIYKLTKTNSRDYREIYWIFKSVQNSVCGSNGYFNTAQEAIDAEIRAGCDVWEFESVKEFAQWLLKNVRE